MNKLKYYSLHDFAEITKIDAHIHLNTNDHSFPEQAKLDNFTLLSINTEVPGYPTIPEQQDIIQNHKQQFSGKVNYLTTFETHTRAQSDWQNRVIRYLEKSFSGGATGVKVWKNIGMDIRDANGHFIKIDDVLFDPIFNYLEQNNLTVCGHIGEPKNCWLPLEEMTVAGDKAYFKDHPEYHMYLHPDYPSYLDLVHSRDRLLEKHPSLKFVGAHLGSLEWSTDEIAKRLDKYSNLAVDLASRIDHLQYQSIADWQKVHDFFIQYQDRIIYGTDLQVDDTHNPAEFRKEAHSTWLADWKYFTSDEWMTTATENYKFRALRLPSEVIDKIYFKNAIHWYPFLNRT